MVIRYKDGAEIEAILLSRREGKLRVAAKGLDDALEFAEINGKWVSEDWEPVQIQFEWERDSRLNPVSEADCICPHELAAELIGGLDPGTDLAAFQQPCCLVWLPSGSLGRHI